jgi:predicted RNA binding protein YcfA (HicA-like mRNA interferase family)
MKNQGAGKASPSYEFNSRKIKQHLEREGWVVVRISGDHYVMNHTNRKGRIVLYHPKKDLPLGTVKQIYKDSGWDI